MSGLAWFHGRKILVTGHTGFKGAWLCKVLVDAGAEVTGYALEPPTQPNLYTLSGVGARIRSVIGDVRELERLKQTFDETQPEIVLHLAAQPIVRASYKAPADTYGTNVMGTVNVCECVRLTPSVRSFLNVTTDKVYENREWVWGYREDERLDGWDPYSNSKSCSELVTHCYARSFLKEKGIVVSTARAGNVIGGGDFAQDRIIPDCVRAAQKGERIVVRNPNSIRPYQHVLEPLFAYLMIAKGQLEKPSLAGAYNVGPDDGDCVATGKLAALFCDAWGDGAEWFSQRDNGPHEANFLKLDCSKLKAAFGWRPRWGVETAVAKTVEWTKAWLADAESVPICMEGQIGEFLNRDDGESNHV